MQGFNDTKIISILGSGWLGLALAESFVGQGYEVKASTRSADRMPEIEAAGAQAFLVDIDQNTDISDFLESDIIIVNITSKNIEAFKRLIKKIQTSRIGKVLFISSTSVYQNTNRMLSESDRAENLESPLYLIENLFRNSPQFQSTVIRFGGLFGYNRHPGRFFGDRSISNADAPINLIHRDDCIGIIDRIVYRGVWSEVFNACADTHPSKREFYSHARESLGLAAPTFADQAQAPFKIISNKKIKRVLDYKFIHADLMTCRLD